jgi:hypothetical protein
VTNTKPTAVIRTGQPPLKFEGMQLATASSKKDGSRHEAKQWYEASVYRTKGGGFVATAVYRTVWAHEREYRWATAHASAAEAITWLQGLDVLSVVAGYPEGEQFARKQERLMDALLDQWEWLVGELLAQCGDEFAEVVP